MILIAFAMGEVRDGTSDPLRMRGLSSVDPVFILGIISGLVILILALSYILKLK